MEYINSLLGQQKSTVFESMETDCKKVCERSAEDATSSLETWNEVDAVRIEQHSGIFGKLVEATKGALGSWFPSSEMDNFSAEKRYMAERRRR